MTFIDVTPQEDIDALQARADALQNQALQFRPVLHPLQGLAQMAQSGVAALLQSRASRQQKERDEARSQALASLMGGGVTPAVGTSPIPSIVDPLAGAATPAAMRPPVDLLAGSVASAAPAPAAPALPGSSGPDLPALLQIAADFPDLEAVTTPLIEARMGSGAETYSLLERPEEFGFAPGTVVQRGSRGGFDVLQKPQDKAEFKTDLGKAIADRQVAIDMYGEDSPQAAAFEEMIVAEQRGEPIDLTDEAGMRKEFSGQSKNFILQRDAFDRIQSVENTAQGDVALIFSYMRLLDPTSTVREGEFATAEQTTGVPTQIVNLYNRLITGERLAPDQRSGFKSQSQELFDSAAERQDELEGQFRGLAKRSGLRPDNVVLDYQGAYRGSLAEPPEGKKLNFDGMTTEELADVDLNSLNKAQLDAYEAALDAAR